MVFRERFGYRQKQQIFGSGCSHHQICLICSLVAAAAVQSTGADPWIFVNGSNMAFVLQWLERLRHAPVTLCLCLFVSVVQECHDSALVWLSL